MALSKETTFRLLGGGGTRGLSGDALRVLPTDASLDFFDGCLRVHRAALDLVADPDQVWDVEAESGPSQSMGLEAHLRTASRERIVSLTDVLVVVSAADWERALAQHGRRWQRHLVGGVRAGFADWCEREDISRRGIQRPLGVRLLVDGGAEMQGESLGLASGEFITGLLPNLYGSPSVVSRPLISVMLNLPGEWEGYREVARLFDDQDLLTLGNHWLDNFSHPALELPALYRLQFDRRDGLVHLISPVASGAFSLTGHAMAEGSSVYGLSRSDGTVVAWLVLAQLESLPSGPAEVMVEAVPTFDAVQVQVPSADDRALFEAETGPVRVVPPVEEADAFAAAVPPPQAAGAPDALPPLAEAVAMGEDQLIRVREAGVLLQRVHFRGAMAGYEVYIGAGGEIGSALDDPAATVQVAARKSRVRLFALQRGVRVGGVPVPVGAAVVLGADVEIELGETSLDYRDLSAVRLPGWPYIGEIRRAGSNLFLPSGAVHTIGRDAECRVKLPDERHLGNIHWRPEVDAGTVIRSRNGDVPKTRFTLDSIMVASKHAELDLTGPAPVVRNVARSCYSFVRRSVDGVASWVGLSRVVNPTGDSTVTLRAGDELLVGNCVLQVLVDSAAPFEVGAPVESPPPVTFSLADDPVERPLGLDSLPPPPPLLLPAPPEELPLVPTADAPAATWLDSDPPGLPVGVGPTSLPPTRHLRTLREEFMEPTHPRHAGAPASSEESLPEGEYLEMPDLMSFPSNSDDPTEVPLPRLLKLPRK